MPSNESVKSGLAVAEDKSKVLGLSVGKHTVEPGLYIPRAGTHSDVKRIHSSKCRH